MSAIEYEFNAFNLQLKARPRKLLLKNISLKNNSFYYNANASTKKPKQGFSIRKSSDKEKTYSKILL